MDLGKAIMNAEKVFEKEKIKPHIMITPGQATEILSVHSRLQTELADQDKIIEGLEGDLNLLQAKLDSARRKITKLEAERERWKEPVHFCEDI
jgi:chromosome segregation ATPase